MNLLKFDASGGAHVRFHGKPWLGYIHESGMLSYHGFPKYDLKLICPAEFGIECSCCKRKMRPRLEACFVLCHSRKRAPPWAVYVVPPVEIGRIMSECQRMGYSDGDMESGNGPDVLIQEGEKAMIIRAVLPPETDAPDLAKELGLAAARSRWIER